MIPDNHASTTPILGALFNPLSLNRLMNFAWGPIAFQDPSQGLTYRIWTAEAVGTDVFIYADGVPSVLFFSRPGRIYNISLAFDPNGNPFIAFQEAGASYLYWFDPVPNDYVFLALPVGSSYPYITLDDPRPFNSPNVDVILGYIRAGAVKFSYLRDRYTVEYSLRIGTSGPFVEADILYYVGMNDRYRVEFIYGDLPNIKDSPDIMKKQVLLQKGNVEVLDVTFDFLHKMLFGESIETAACVVTVESGTDPSPNAMMVGSPTHTTRSVTQTIEGGIVGNVYRISMSARTDNDCVYVVEGLLAINDSPATDPPALP